MTIEYHLLKELEHNPAHTQRTLAQALDISLGKVNYVISGLMEKGIIKAKKLKNEPENIRWHYILTSMGIQEKIRITRDYLQRRLSEYETIRKEIEVLQKEVVLTPPVPAGQDDPAVTDRVMADSRVTVQG